MDKKRVELIITLGLVIIFIFVLAVNLKPKKPKQKLSPSSKISEKEKGVSISKKKIEKILRASPQEIEKQKNRAQLSWGRDPFFSSFLVKKEVSKTTSLTLKGVTIGKDKKGYAFINDEIVTIGDTIEGYQVIEIQKNKVILKRDNELFYLTLPY
ncbi:MAG: hypothetical protein J7K71_04160 [Candidatus Omnitrophica bacterium]|nr:hypothetical protein [Candidatus Omnitrophota bacterium]